MRLVGGITLATGCGVAVVAYLRWRRRPPARPGAGVPVFSDEDDQCAICLEMPRERCVTSCGHRFCIACFRAWAERQVPPVSNVRCPLCVTAVNYLRPEGAMLASADKAWLWGYNLFARDEARWAGEAVEFVRGAIGSIACALYLIGGREWQNVSHYMRGTFVAWLPGPTDAKLRAMSQWLVWGHSFTLIRWWVGPPDEANAELGELIARVRPWALGVIASQRDARHARFTLGPYLEAELTAMCRGSHNLSYLLRLAHMLLRKLHGRQPELTTRWWWPWLLRALELAAVVAEVSAYAAHVRLELAGLRGLTALARWRFQCAGVDPYKCRPHESGLFLRRYCYIEEYNEHEQLFSKRGLPWAEALCEYALPLRALVLFHTRKHLLEDRAFPQWAVHSIEAAILSSGPLEA